MVLGIRQSLKLSQNLLMTPQLQQAIKLLQLSRMELEQFVSQQLSENPALEESISKESHEEVTQSDKERERTSDDMIREHMSEASGIVDSIGDKKDEVDWERMTRLKEMSQQPAAQKKNSGSDEAPNYENMVSKAETLAEHLMNQVMELDFDDREKHIAYIIIGNINAKGFLESPIEEMSEKEGFSIDELEDILDTIQRFDPPGVGARNLEECLMIQLREHHLKNGIVEKILVNHMKELETRNYNQIAKVMSLTLDQVIENVAIIAELDPVPGRQYGGETAQIIIPDVYVFKLGEKWIVSLNEEGIPRLQVSEYCQGIETKTRGDDKEYLKEKLKSAQWLIKSIQQRQRTIFKVTECILERQMEFFEKGLSHLKPMVLKDIAEDIGMHESTISRVTNNKFVHTPRGIFELKYFFNSSVSRSDGDDMASESVKAMVKEIVGREDPKKPYSDQKIVSFLEEKGVKLARRTVAKYREQLGILPSSKRKKYF